MYKYIVDYNIVTYAFYSSKGVEVNLNYSETDENFKYYLKKKLADKACCDLGSIRIKRILKEIKL